MIGIRKPNTDEAWNKYINAIFPVAAKYGYNPGIAFNVIQPTRGSYHPGFVAIASWPQATDREKFRKDPSLPKDLDAQRRTIWSRFDQLFFEKLEQQISFEARADHIYIFTAYWLEDPDLFQAYHQYELAAMDNFNGHLISILGKGTSPKNHLYDPDLLLFSAWLDLESFTKYREKVDGQFQDRDGLKNIQEFVTTYVFGF